MAVNLNELHCDVCGAPVHREKRTRKMRGCRFPQFNGMVVANAECTECKSKYTAWVEWGSCSHAKMYSSRVIHPRYDADPIEEQFFDLSYRSTFNDEAGDGDIPVTARGLPFRSPELWDVTCTLCDNDAYVVLKESDKTRYVHKSFTIPPEIFLCLTCAEKFAK